MIEEIFMSYAAIAARHFDEAMQRDYTARHWHEGFDLPGGGRIYFEVRLGK